MKNKIIASEWQTIICCSAAKLNWRIIGGGENSLTHTQRCGENEQTSNAKISQLLHAGA